MKKAKKSPARKVAAKKVGRRKVVRPVDSIREAVADGIRDFAKIQSDALMRMELDLEKHRDELAQMREAIEFVGSKRDRAAEKTIRVVQELLSSGVSSQLHGIGLATSDDLKWLREEMS